MNIGSTLKVAKNVVTSKAGRQLLKGQKHSPTILFVTGVVGVVTTTVLASKATLQLEDILNENEAKHDQAKELLASGDERYSAKKYTQDAAVLRVRLVKDIGRLYAPAVVVGVVSVCALGGSHIILTKRNAGLMAAYAALDKGFNEYRTRVIEAVGPDKERELRFGSEQREIAEDTENGVEVKTITTVGSKLNSQYARFFDQLCPSWKPQAEYNLVFLRCQQQYANDLLHARGHVFLNEVYDMIGVPRTKAGSVVGWVKNNGDNFVDFGVYDSENHRARDFVNGREGAILLDFNVDGVIYDKI